MGEVYWGNEQIFGWWGGLTSSLPTRENHRLVLFGLKVFSGLESFQIHYITDGEQQITAI